MPADEIHEEQATVSAAMRKKQSRWAMSALLAACAAVVLPPFFLHIQKSSGDTQSAPPSVSAHNPASVSAEETLPEKQEINSVNGLPFLDIADCSVGAGGGLMAYDFSQLANDNPWTPAAALSTLPVYRNDAYHSSGVPAGGMDETEMRALAQKTADILGWEISEILTERVNEGLLAAHSDPDRIYQITAKTQCGAIQIESNHDITLHFEPEVTLPASLPRLDAGAAIESAGIVADYFIEAYRQLLPFTAPAAAVSMDFSFYGDPHFWTRAYDGAGDLTDQILSYHFDAASFYPSEDGKYDILRLRRGLFGAEKLGDYPILSPEAARQALLSGNYLSPHPQEMPGEEYVMGVELVYATGNINRLFLPYYCFWVEIPGYMASSCADFDCNLRFYATYYVPAIQPEYIGSLPRQGVTLNWG